MRGASHRPRTRGGSSRVLRGASWVLLLVGLGGVGFGAPREMAAEAGGQPLHELALIVGLAGGGLPLFLSVLLDRLHAYNTDRYRRLQK